jgi:hypothetical protein
VYDTWKFLDSKQAKNLFEKCCRTLELNINKYDHSYWSLYEQANVKLPMIASPFYHRLHIVQLKILSELSGIRQFQDTAEKWESYTSNRFNRYRALLNKCIFKVLYY